uniref:Metalloendopeptidase n=1 Tax=Soboliphyme baturini TaxID=241478 RepID=A0A183II73_9BILA
LQIDCDGSVFFCECFQKGKQIATSCSTFDTTLDVEDFADSAMIPDVDLKKMGLRGEGDPLLKARKFEGDILGISNSEDVKLSRVPDGAARSAIRDKWRRWPTKEIPYVLSSRYGSYSRKVIAKAMDQYHKKTCIRFVPRDPQKHTDYVYLFPDDGCYSLVGRSGGRQPISLDPGCMEVGTIIHELMHSVGFFHEQSRTDRDEYIKVIWTKIMPGAKDQFEKYDSRTVDQLNINYDYGSIMHYGPYAFSKNGEKTILALKRGASRMGQRDGFSELDLMKVKKLYDCGDMTNVSVTTNELSPEDDNEGDVNVEPRTTGGAKCLNEKWECYFWAFLNHCRLYPEYMRQNCRKACNMCNEDAASAAVTTTATEASTVRRKKCEDQNGHCNVWASRGFCDKTGYRHFMLATCPMSCQDCESGKLMASDNELPQTRDYGEAAQVTATHACADKRGLEARCKLFASWQMCGGRNERDMRHLCPSSCGYCGEGKGKSSTTVSWRGLSKLVVP